MGTARSRDYAREALDNFSRFSHEPKQQATYARLLKTN